MSKKNKIKEEEPVKEELVNENVTGEVSEDQSMESEEKCLCEEAEDDLTLAKKAFEELNDKHLRLQAEFDNYRKRTMREKSEMLKSAGESVLSNILPVIDDFDRGLAVMHSSTDLKAVVEGMDLIYSKFQEFLNRNGVKPMECVGLELDTDLHEAITTIPAPNDELKGKIVDCVQKGYVLNDKVIRYAKVVVGE